jgi:hypothetical protein
MRDCEEQSLVTSFDGRMNYDRHDTLDSLGWIDIVNYINIPSRLT